MMREMIGHGGSTSGDGAARGVHVAVELGLSLRSSLGDEGAAELLRGMTRYIEGVVTDLHLPAPQVEVHDTSAPPEGFQVIINGVACRIPVEQDRGVAPVPSPQALSSRIAQVVHVNRELLVDARIAETFRASGSPGQPKQHLAGLSQTALLDCLRLLLRGCFHLDRGDGKQDSLSNPARPPVQRQTAEACYEETARSLSGLQCALLHPPGATAGSTFDDQPIEQLVDLMEEGLFYELGVRFPRLKLQTDKRLGKSEFRIRVNDLRLPPITGLSDDEFLVNDSPAGLRGLKIDGHAAANPATGAEAAIVAGDEEVARKVRDHGLTVWGRVGYMILACIAALRRHVGAYIVAEGVEHDLDILNDSCPNVIAAAKSRFGVPAITQALRSLAEEDISIRNLVGVLDAMLAVKSTVDVDFAKSLIFFPYVTALCPKSFGARVEDLKPAAYAECVRPQFKEYISHKYTRGWNTLVVYRLDPVIESRVARSNANPLTDREKADILNAVQKSIRRLSSIGQAPVILTTVGVRRPFRQLIEVEFPSLAVLASQEISPRLNIQTIARISLG